MNNFLVKLLVKIRVRALRPVLRKLEIQAEMLRAVANNELKARVILKQLQGQRITVVFVCHAPSLWGKIDSLHSRLVSNPRFDVVVVAVPYKHNRVKPGEYFDGGMCEFLKKNEVEYISGMDKETGAWLNLQNLHPDYVFFQTPYSVFPETYSAEFVSLFAEVCYIPYVGILIYEGDVEEIALPVSFFKYVSYAFMPNEMEAENLKDKLAGIIDGSKIKMCGAPMLDYTLEASSHEEGAWKLSKEEGRKRILWTPRWRTNEGNCHFFDYTNKLLDYAENSNGIEFIFRPHSLCFSNFELSGELTREEQMCLRERFSNITNASIDEYGGYQDTFISSDMLISDMSSILGEYIVTGKPIIYTHRVDTFNEFGRRISQGFYWVRNYSELIHTLEMLLSGEDPLKETRKTIVRELYYIPEQGAAQAIERELTKQFHSALISGK